MSSEFSDDELDLFDEPVERRRAARGPVQGLMARLPGIDEPETVVEAGLGGMFVATQELGRFAEDQRFEVTLTCRDLVLTCGVRVVRKESGRRHGLALQIVDITDAARAIFEEMRS